MMPTLFGVTTLLLACAVMLVIGLAGRPANGLSVPTGSHVVHVDEFDYGIRLPAGPLPAGNVVLVDTNRGTIPHELVMFATKAGAPLPMRKDGSLNEDSPALENVIDSGSALQPGETRLLSATLDKGTYVIVCNLPSHFRLGMHRFVVVR